MTAACIAMLTALALVLTCGNVQRAVKYCGKNVVIEKSRALGATEEQIKLGLNCLKKK